LQDERGFKRDNMKKTAEFLSILMKAALVIFSLFNTATIFINIITGTHGTQAVVYFSIMLISLTIMISVVFSRCNFNKIYVILMVGFILRALWILNANTYPVSDYYTMYSAAGEVVAGNFSAFWGTNYMARFPHLTVMTLYMAVMRLVFGSFDVMTMKFINLLLGTLNIYLIYLLSIRLNGENSKRGAYITASLAAVFPPFITYTGILCPENIAITFYILSMIMFFSYLENNKPTCLPLCGIILAIGSLFRTVGIVILIGYMMYMTIYSDLRASAKVKNIFKIIIPYFFVILSVSSLLQFCGVTQYPLWDGYEPNSTNVLKGVNFETGGKWSEDDGEFVMKYLDDADMLDRMCKERIVRRLSDKSLYEICNFFGGKLSSQWTSGDSGGTFWTKISSKEGFLYVPADEYNFLPFQLFCAIMYIVFITGIIRNKSKKLNLIYIIFGGYISLFCITEFQPRYSMAAMYIMLLTETYS